MAAKTGRPPLEPRIAKLESEFKRLQTELDQMRQRFALSQGIPMNQEPAYKPQFERWGQ